VAAGVWFALTLPSLRALVRPIYIERGVLVASTGDAAAKST
jgi:hypothetical protein